MPDTNVEIRSVCLSKTSQPCRASAASANPPGAAEGVLWDSPQAPRLRQAAVSLRRVGTLLCTRLPARCIGM